METDQKSLTNALSMQLQGLSDEHTYNGQSSDLSEQLLLHLLFTGEVGDHDSTLNTLYLCSGSSSNDSV